MIPCRGKLTNSMKKLIFITTIISFAILSCEKKEKDELGPEITNEDTMFVIPCTPEKNTIYYNLQKITYSSVNTTNDPSSAFGDYAMETYGSNTNFSIQFKSTPVTKVYKTQDLHTIYEEGDCIVNGTFSNYSHVATTGQNVYVTKLGENRYSVSFCDLVFNSGSTTSKFVTDGNLTSK